MNKLELLSVLREMVKDELKELFKTKEGRTFLREVIGKEVRIEVDKLLTEMETREGDVIQEEVKPNPKLSNMVSRGELPPKKVPPQGIPFTKNKALNSILNQTLESIKRGEADLPSTLGPEAQTNMLREQYSNMSMGTSPVNTPQMDTGKPLSSMLPDKDVNGNPLMINPNALPDHVQSALTRDYRKLMKKVEEKRG